MIKPRFKVSSIFSLIFAGWRCLWDEHLALLKVPLSFRSAQIKYNWCRAKYVSCRCWWRWGSVPDAGEDGRVLQTDFEVFHLLVRNLIKGEKLSYRWPSFFTPQVTQTDNSRTPTPPTPPVAHSGHLTISWTLVKGEFKTRHISEKTKWTERGRSFHKKKDCES